MIQGFDIVGLLFYFRRSLNGTRCATLGMRIANNTFGRGGKKWSWPVLEC
jgi:hypothetical protein